MGLYFGHSSLRSSYEEPKGILKPVAQPDPYNFKIIKEVSGNDCVLAFVNYPDATNFEGNKIILIRGTTSLKGMKALDPHFLKCSSIEVIARLRPTDEGWNLGMNLLKGI